MPRLIRRETIEAEMPNARANSFFVMLNLSEKMNRFAQSEPLF
jgi:hypothetical protein